MKMMRMYKYSKTRSEFLLLLLLLCRMLILLPINEATMVGRVHHTYFLLV